MMTKHHKELIKRDHEHYKAGSGIDTEYSKFEQHLASLEQTESKYLGLSQNLQGDVQERKRARFDMESEIEQLKIHSLALEQYNTQLRDEMKWINDESHKMKI